MDKEWIKVGIWGTGFAARSHLEAISRIQEVEVVAIASQDPSRADHLAHEFGIDRSYGSYEDLLRDPDVEVVHNCTSNHLHYPLNRLALLAGKHVLSEKPLATGSKEAGELAKLAKERGLVGGVCFNYRHYPMVAEAKEWIRSGRTGPIHLVTGGYFQDWLLLPTDYNWRLEPEQNGPSRAIADIGSHWCDTVQYVTGLRIVEVLADLKTVHSVRHKPRKTSDTFAAPDSSGDSGREEVTVTTEDCGNVLIRFENGAHGVFTVSQVTAGRKNRLHFEISGQSAAVSWDQEKPNLLWIGKRDEPNLELLKDPALLADDARQLAHYPGGHQEGWPDGLKNLFIRFYETVRARKRGEETNHPVTFATFEDGYRLALLVEAILQSHRTRQWTAVTEG
jgi:predicted dehydrogenase